MHDSPTRRCCRALERMISRATAALVVLAAAAAAPAQEWTPTRPIRLIVPFNPGGAGDVTARAISDKLSAALGQPVVVDNRGGAGGIIGTDAAAKSTPDGYTLVLGSDANFTIAPNLQPVGYDPLKDFEPVSLIVNTPMVLTVNPQRLPVNSIQELLAAAKASPGRYTIASSGNGTSHHIAIEKLKGDAGIDILHVPYKGQAQAINDVLGGQADLLFGTPGPLLPHIRSGKLKPLAVTVSHRIADLPDVPTLAEAGVPGYDISIWLGVLYPAKTPKAAIERINTEINRILATPEARGRYAAQGYSPVGGKPEVLAKRLADDTAAYRRIIQQAKIKPE